MTYNADGFAREYVKGLNWPLIRALAAALLVGGAVAVLFWLRGG